MKITLVNLSDGSVEGHRAGCADLTRSTRNGQPRKLERFTEEFATQRSAFLCYNEDFLAEGTEEDDCYQIYWLPCAKALPSV